jgi:hypothetical protein
MLSIARITVPLIAALLWATPGALASPDPCSASVWHVRETDSEIAARVTAATTFPSALDPRLWDGMAMKPEVRHKTLAIVEDLVTAMRMGPEITVASVELFGSNASYEYDDAADFGVHVFLNNANPAIDLKSFANFLRVYNGYVELHQEGKIRFNGVVVEITFHADPRSGNYRPKAGIGQYLISEDRWIVEPLVQPDNFDRATMAADARRWIDAWNGLVCEYTAAPETFDCGRFDELDGEMKDYRGAGFEKGLGSRSTENLTYRMLRRLSVNIPDGVDLAEQECRNRQFSIGSDRHDPGTVP